MVWAEAASGPPEQGPRFAARLTRKPWFCFSAFVSQASATMHLPAAIGESSCSSGTQRAAGGPGQLSPASWGGSLGRLPAPRH